MPIYEFPIASEALVAAIEACLLGFSPGGLKFGCVSETPGSTTYRIWQSDLGDLGNVEVPKIQNDITQVTLYGPPIIRRRRMTPEETISTANLSGDEQIAALVKILNKIREDADQVNDIRLSHFSKVVEVILEKLSHENVWSNKSDESRIEQGEATTTRIATENAILVDIPKIIPGLLPFASGKWEDGFASLWAALKEFSSRNKEKEFGKHLFKFIIIEKPAFDEVAAFYWMIAIYEFNRETLQTVEMEDGTKGAEGGWPYAEFRARIVPNGLSVKFLRNESNSDATNAYLSKLFNSLIKDGFLPTSSSTNIDRRSRPGTDSHILYENRRCGVTLNRIYIDIEKLLARYEFSGNQLDGIRLEKFGGGDSSTQILLQIARFSDFGTIGHVEVEQLNELDSRITVVYADLLPSFVEKREEIHQAAFDLLTKIAKNLFNMYGGELRTEESSLRESLSDEQSVYKYIFHMKGKQWEIAYKDGDKFYLDDLKGLRYLAYLLSKPNIDIDVMELDLAVYPPEISDSTSTIDDVSFNGIHDPGYADEIVDDRTVRENKKRLIELSDERKEAEIIDSIENDEKLIRIDEEYEKIETYLNAALGLGGRKKVFDSQKERTRIRITNNIKYALKCIKVEDEKLYKYFRRPTIKGGNYFSYNPGLDNPIEWNM